LTVRQRKALAQFLIDDYKVSQRRACLTIQLWLTTFRRVTNNKNDDALRARIKEIAAVHIRYGEARVYKRLRREGWHVNHKRVRRIYREEGLNLRLKRPRRSRACKYRSDRPQPTKALESWAMDFVHDQLFDNRKIRCLTVVDIYTRYCLTIEVRKSFTSLSVAEIMESLKQKYKTVPKTIRLDNGPEFIGKELDQWADFNDVDLDFSRKGKPTDNAFCESFNGTLRDECLNTNWFLSLEQAKDKISAWTNEYNCFRQHSSINDLTPEEMMNQSLKTLL
jgi:putative transposase